MPGLSQLRMSCRSSVALKPHQHGVLPAAAVPEGGARPPIEPCSTSHVALNSQSCRSHVTFHELQTVRLVGVAALAPEVNAAKNLVRLQPGSDAFRAALATLQQINGCVCGQRCAKPPESVVCTAGRNNLQVMLAAVELWPQ
jgi:hypothetical protein